MLILYLMLAGFSISQLYAWWTVRTWYEPEYTHVKTEALDALSSALALRPWDGKLMKQVGDMEYYMGKRSLKARGPSWDRAEASYFHALNWAPSHYLTPWAMSSLIREKGNPSEDWIGFSAQAFKLYPVHRILKKETALFFYQESIESSLRLHMPEAREYLQLASAQSPIPFWEFFSEGVFAVQSGDHKKGIHALNTCVQLHREIKGEHRAEDWLYFQQMLLELAKQRQMSENWRQARQLVELSARNEKYIGEFFREQTATFHRDLLEDGEALFFFNIDGFEYGNTMLLLSAHPIYEAGKKGATVSEEGRTPRFVIKYPFEIQYGHWFVPAEYIVFPEDPLEVELRIRFLDPQAHTRVKVYLEIEITTSSQLPLRMRIASPLVSVQDEEWHDVRFEEVYREATFQFNKTNPAEKARSITVKAIGVSVSNCREFELSGIRLLWMER